MDYLRGYKVFTQDPEWTGKLMVGSVLFLSTMIIPVVGQLALLGWAGLLVRKLVRGETGPMPRLEFDMEYLKQLLPIGIKAFFANLVWTIPLIFVGMALGCAFYFAMVMMVVGGSAAGGDAGGGLGMLCAFASMMMMMPLMALLSIPARVAVLRAELTDDMNEGFKFREVLQFTKRNFKELALGTILHSFVGMIVGMIGYCFCIIGVFPAAVLIMIANAHFIAQVYQLDVERGGERLFVAASEITMNQAPQGAQAWESAQGGQGGWNPPPNQ